ncbi:hypothetical protein M758_UG146800, partial [Ceratodon purpureus]
IVDLRLVEKYLGVQFAYCSEGIFLHQAAYARNMLKKFNIESCKLAYTPLPSGLHLTSETQTPEVDSTMYCEIVRSLLYYTITWTYLQFAIGLVSRFMVQPQQAHLDACMHILRYVKHTLNYGILYQ